MIEWILLLAGTYLAAGVVFTPVFHRAGLVRMDPGAAGAGWFFRLLITPGIVALWPVLWTKWRRSRRGEGAAGSAEAPLSPLRLRALHRWLVTLLALGLPPLVAGGLLLRPAVPLRASALPAQPRPLPAELLRLDTPPEGLPVSALIRGGPAGRRQIELRIERDLEIPSLVLFASPPGGATPEAGSALPPGSVFVGPVHGPGVLRYELPKRQSGVFVFYSLARQERVASWDYQIVYAKSPAGGD